MLGVDVAAALPRLRAQAESRMTAACTVDRSAGDPDPVTGVAPSAPVWAGLCRVQTWEPHEAADEVAGRRRTVQRYAVHVPVGVFTPAVDDVVTVTSSPEDPRLSGRRYRVVALLHKSASTAYRLEVEEVLP